MNIRAITRVLKNYSKRKSPIDFFKKIGQGAERTKGKSHKVLPDTQEPRFELLPEGNHRAVVPPVDGPVVVDIGPVRVVRD